MQQVIDQPQTKEQPLISPAVLLDHWQAQRRLTRKVISAFPEDAFVNYSIGGMRPFAEMVAEFIGMAHHGMNGIAAGKWGNLQETKHHGLPDSMMNKKDLLAEWDRLTHHINNKWSEITLGRFLEVDMAFGLYENKNYSTILYFIENEVHHRGQAYVYLRSIGIEPPAFWDTI